MAEISVKGIVKAFEEDNNILDGLSFEVFEGERVGLLGKNGCGKTTLFRIMVGEIFADEGEVVLPQGRRIGLISQIPKYPAHYTTEDVLKSAHRELYAMQAEMQDLEKQMESSDDPALLQQYDKLAARFSMNGGYEMDVARNRVANGLAIPQAQREQLFDSLSGGEKTRINLARLIIEDTDILLLDEPTNHLDMKACEWLESYLEKFKGTVLVISHDRYFLDKVVQRTIEIVNGKAEFYSGNYSFFAEEKQRRYAEQLKKFEKQQAEIKRLQDSADRLYQWGTGNKRLMQKSFAIQSRIDRMEKVDRPGAERKLGARFGEKSFAGDEVLVMKGVSKSFASKTLFQDINLKIGPGERIALIGDNGTGKSTLIKLIMGEEIPSSGMIKRGPSVKSAYLPQIIRFKDPSRNILDTMIWDENCTPQTARNRLGAFKFTGEDVFRPVSQLSGGEQSRLRLCILMKEDINFLILDEPTNHLDILSREWIEEAVEDYEEALLFVSHDRYFISKFATRIWELADGEIRDFPGTYEQYMQYKQNAVQREQQKKAEMPKEKTAKPKRSGGRSPEKQIAKLEKEIANLEEKRGELRKMVEAFSSDYEKLMELEAEQAELQTVLDEKYDIWAELSE